MLDLCWSLFLIKFIKNRLTKFIKNRIQHKCFLVKFEKFLKTKFWRTFVNDCFSDNTSNKPLNPFFYFNKCLWTFQIFYSGHNPAWYTPANDDQCIFIIYYSASSEITKQFSTTIRINLTRSHFYNLTALVFSYK